MACEICFLLNQIIAPIFFFMLSMLLCGEICVYEHCIQFYQSFICYINLIRSPSLCESQDFVLTRNGLHISVL